MNIMRWRNKRREGDIERIVPGRSPGGFRTEMDRLFDRFFQEFGGSWMESVSDLSQWVPAFDISETDKTVTIRAEVPGVDPKDIDLTISGNVLTVSGEKRESSEEESGNVYRAERRFGRFQRSVELPSSVDPDQVTAEHRNGVLTVTLQRNEKSLPKRIPVRS